MTKTIIFDLGAVMVNWNPQAIVLAFTVDASLQQSIINKLFLSPLWIEFDNGLITETELIARASSALSLSINQVSELMALAKKSLSAKPEMVKLLQLAHNTGLKTYCLSNLSHEWFYYLTQRHEFFKLFDGKVISAQEKMGKPNPIIYTRLIERYNINVNNTLFVDDREDNIQAAKKLGIKGIVFQHTEENLNRIKQFIQR